MFPSQNIPAQTSFARLQRTAEPASEPITTAEAKLWAKVDATDDDALIAELIKATRATVEQLTSRALIDTTLRASWDLWPRRGTYVGAPLSRELELPIAPLISVASVKYLDESNVEQTIAAGNYYTSAAGERDRFPRIRFDDSFSLPTLAARPNALYVDFHAGYGADATFVPPELKVAVRLLFTHLYQNRVPAVIGTIVNEMPMSLSSLIQMHQVRTLV